VLLFLLPSSPSLQKKKKSTQREGIETTATNQELPGRHGAALCRGAGGGCAKAAELRVADQCSPAQKPHLPGLIPNRSGLWHFPQFFFPLVLQANDFAKVQNSWVLTQCGYSGQKFLFSEKKDFYLPNGHVDMWFQFSLSCC